MNIENILKISFYIISILSMGICIYSIISDYLYDKKKEKQEKQNEKY